MDPYAVPPEDFVAARTEQVQQARAAGDRALARQLAAQRRPTVSAYAVNALVRAEPELVDALLDLGLQLASAQAEGRGEQLRGLGEQRRALVEAVAARAEQAAGRDLGAAVRAEVVATLEAVLADPVSGTAVRSGRLVRPLAYAGFGAVDLQGAVAGAPTGQDEQGREAAAEQGREVAAEQERRRQQAGQRLAEAQQAALSASGALDDAVRTAERLAAEQEAAASAAAAAHVRVEQAERDLAAARAGREETTAALLRSDRVLAGAQEDVTAAQQAAERARAAVDRLRRNGSAG